MAIRDYPTQIQAEAARNELLRLGWTVSHVWYDKSWHLVTNIV